LTQKIAAVEFKGGSIQRGPAAAVCGGLLAVLLFAIYRTDWPQGGAAFETTASGIGVHLMTDYLLPFEVVSVLLLAVLIGAARMARREGKSR
jgi:NADH:ubiquinone oxidoreductase subunit 6 (subunit J)